MGSGGIRRQLKRTLFALLALFSIWMWIGVSAVPGRATDVVVSDATVFRLSQQPFYLSLIHI